jgi:hypothetical protein
MNTYALLIEADPSKNIEGSCLRDIENMALALKHGVESAP